MITATTPQGSSQGSSQDSAGDQARRRDHAPGVELGRVVFGGDAVHVRAFQAIKESLLHAPILALPDPDRPFSVVCDASDFAIGSALLQIDVDGPERVIAYESRQLKATENNYPGHDKELLAIKYALVKFRVHLLGSKPFVIYTDHASLRTATQSPHL